jgi:hypothetical protein
MGASQAQTPPAPNHPPPVAAKPLDVSLKYITLGELAILTQQDWVEVARVMGDPTMRGIVMDQLRKAEPFPAKLWVDLLKSEELTVRLGALEVLEDFTGQDLDFDPWELDAAQRDESWQRWSAWAGDGGKALPGTGASALSTEAMQGYLRDIMSGEASQTERALAKLKPFSRQSIGSIETFLSSQSSLLPGMRGRLKEAQYRLLLDLAGVRDARRAARNLAIGTRDERVEGLDLISSAPKIVLPIVGELLRDPDALVRERAMDVLLAIGQVEPFLWRNSNSKERRTRMSSMRPSAPSARSKAPPRSVCWCPSSPAMTRTWWLPRFNRSAFWGPPRTLPVRRLKTA